MRARGARAAPRRPPRSALGARRAATTTPCATGVLPSRSRRARCGGTSSRCGCASTTTRTARWRFSTGLAVSPATGPTAAPLTMAAAGRLSPLDGPHLWTWGQRCALATNPTGPTTAVKPCATNTGQLNVLSTALASSRRGGYATLPVALRSPPSQRRWAHPPSRVAAPGSPVAAVDPSFICA